MASKTADGYVCPLALSLLSLMHMFNLKRLVGLLIILNVQLSIQIRLYKIREANEKTKVILHKIPNNTTKETKLN